MSTKTARVNPAVLPLLSAHWAMEPSAQSHLEHRLLALPADVDVRACWDDDDDEDDGPAGGGPSGQSPRKPYQMAGGVALLTLAGPLQKEDSWLTRWGYGTSTQVFRVRLAQAAADPDVTAIMVLIDSPGGLVDGTAEAADDVYAVRQAGKKPIAAVIEDTGCSAAYWIASQCQSVALNQTGWAGSIGTRFSLIDVSGMYEEMGWKRVEITTGTYKSAGAPGLPITDKDVAYFQGIVGDTQTRFTAAVARGRKMPLDKVRDIADDARIYVGKGAQDAGLVDEIATASDVVKRLQKPGGYTTPKNRKSTSALAGRLNALTGESTAHTGKENFAMKQMLVAALAALGLHTLAGKVAGTPDDDAQALANVMASEVRAEVDAQVSKNPLVAALAAEGITDPAQITALRVKAAAHDQTLGQVRVKAAADARIAYVADPARLAAALEDIEATADGPAFTRLAARLDTDAEKAAPKNGATPLTKPAQNVAVHATDATRDEAPDPVQAATRGYVNGAYAHSMPK